MAKLIVMYPTPTDVSEFEKVYQDEHVPLAIEKLSGKTKIVATKVLGTGDGSPPPFYRIAEVHFPSMQALDECAGSAGGKETVEHAIKISSGGARRCCLWRTKRPSISRSFGCAPWHQQTGTIRRLLSLLPGSPVSHAFQRRAATVVSRDKAFAACTSLRSSTGSAARCPASSSTCSSARGHRRWSSSA